MKPSKEVLPVLNSKGEIEMGKEVFYYSSHSSPYLTHALLIAQKGEKQVLALVEVRAKDEFCPNVSVFDFGGTISNDYLAIGYNFNQIKPLAVV